ncbi:hypothetical protein BJX66DRAFT_320422 [Aspergillus keveii]|uniref:Uncharacterized protein n=1 Tax=Aspergillus keveii TaxID=714993 RepID=A0ABR4FH51_9EURO
MANGTDNGDRCCSYGKSAATSEKAPYAAIRLIRERFRRTKSQRHTVTATATVKRACIIDIGRDHVHRAVSEP